MDIENLNGTQIVLLTLLVSFVTSIATGIVTVTLMDQAPPAITNTIHKVVEKTVEVVTPKSQMATVKKEIVIVKEQNIIADVVEKNEESVIRINKEDVEDSRLFVNLGVILDKKGLIVTSSENIEETDNYFVVVDEEKINLEIIKIGSDITYLKTIDSDEGIFKTVFKTVNLANSNSLKLGQSIVMLGGIKSTEVLTGIISGLIQEERILEGGEGEDSIVEKYISNIKTNIPNTEIISGAPLLNLEGEVVGLNLDSATNSFVLINISKEEIENLLTNE